MSKPVATVVEMRGKQHHQCEQLTEHQLMKLLLELEQRIVACEQLLGLAEERPRLKLVKGHQR